MYSPHVHAARLRIPITYEADLPDLGRWYPTARRIVLRAGMAALVERSVLAHEIAHVVLGHPETTAKNEALADRWAARQLVTIDELEQAAAVSEDPGQWCVDLMVTPHILSIYLTLPEVRSWHSQRNARQAG